MARGREARDEDLQPLDRGVDEPHRSAAAVLLRHHMPGLQRMADLERDAAMLDLAVQRKAELALGFEPLSLEGVACPAEISQDGKFQPAVGSVPHAWIIRRLVTSPCRVKTPCWETA